VREVMPMQGSMSVERMCQLAQVSRAGLAFGKRPAPEFQRESTAAVGPTAG
jgi:hypothetical protein